MKTQPMNGNPRARARARLMILEELRAIRNDRRHYSRSDRLMAWLLGVSLKGNRR